MLCKIFGHNYKWTNTNMPYVKIIDGVEKVQVVTSGYKICKRCGSEKYVVSQTGYYKPPFMTEYGEGRG